MHFQKPSLKHGCNSLKGSFVNPQAAHFDQAFADHTTEKARGRGRGRALPLRRGSPACGSLGCGTGHTAAWQTQDRSRYAVLLARTDAHLNTLLMKSGVPTNPDVCVCRKTSNNACRVEPVAYTKTGITILDPFKTKQSKFTPE